MPAKKPARASVISRATEHFKAKPLKRIEIPEWGEYDDNGELIEPLVVYSTPFTLKDQSRIRYVAEKQSEVDVLAEVLVMKLIDENGDKVFTIEDKNALRNSVDASVVSRIATSIMSVSEVDLEKN